MSNHTTVAFELDDYLRIGTAAMLLGVHPDTLRRWGKAKKLMVYRHPISRYRLFRRQDIEGLRHAVQLE